MVGSELDEAAAAAALVLLAIIRSAATSRTINEIVARTLTDAVRDSHAEQKREEEEERGVSRDDCCTHSVDRLQRQSVISVNDLTHPSSYRTVAATRIANICAVPQSSLTAVDGGHDGSDPVAAIATNIGPLPTSDV